jgi:hypothetical protein
MLKFEMSKSELQRPCKIIPITPDMQYCVSRHDREKKRGEWLQPVMVIVKVPFVDDRYLMTSQFFNKLTIHTKEEIAHLLELYQLLVKQGRHSEKRCGTLQKEFERSFHMAFTEKFLGNRQLQCCCMDLNFDSEYLYSIFYYGLLELIQIQIQEDPENCLEYLEVVFQNNHQHVIDEFVSMIKLKITFYEKLLAEMIRLSIKYGYLQLFIELVKLDDYQLPEFYMVYAFKYAQSDFVNWLMAQKMDMDIVPDCREYAFSHASKEWICKLVHCEYFLPDETFVSAVDTCSIEFIDILIDLMIQKYQFDLIPWLTPKLFQSIILKSNKIVPFAALSLLLDLKQRFDLISLHK